jgi:hypothetical protein
MKDRPENKKEAPGKADPNEDMKLPGMEPGGEKQEKEEKKNEKKDAGPLSEEQYSSQKNQSGKNTDPDSED